MFHLVYAKEEEKLFAESELLNGFMLDPSICNPHRVIVIRMLTVSLVIFGQRLSSSDEYFLWAITLSQSILFFPLHWNFIYLFFGGLGHWNFN